MEDENTTITKRFVEPYDFLFYISPSIPYDFPKERIPKYLCEDSLLSVFKCYLDYEKQNEEIKRGEACHKYAQEFDQCKRRRDMAIFNEIRSWETEKYSNLKPGMKPVYINALKEELENLKSEFEKIPASENTAEKRWRVNNDILQMKWRISNVEGKI